MRKEIVQHPKRFLAGFTEPTLCVSVAFTVAYFGGIFLTTKITKVGGLHRRRRWSVGHRLDYSCSGSVDDVGVSPLRSVVAHHTAGCTSGSQLSYPGDTVTIASGIHNNTSWFEFVRVTYTLTVHHAIFGSV